MIVYRSALIPRKLSCPSWLRAVLLTLILFWLLHHTVYWFYNSLQYTLFIFTNHFFLNPFMTEADMLRKSMDWFLYDIGLRHERVMTREAVSFEKVFHWTQWNQKKQFSWNLKVVLKPGYTVKYFFQSISCKLPRNVHDIYFEAFHEIRKFWKPIFRIFSIVKDFPIEFVFKRG